MSVTPKRQEKSSELLSSVESSEESEIEAVDQQEQRKSSSSMEPKKKESLPQPPPKPKAGRSLLATDDGDDVPLYDSEDPDNEDIDMLAQYDTEPEKPRMSFSLRFLSRKKKEKKGKPGAGRASFMGFFLPKNANKAFDDVKNEDESRGDSVVWRRKESKELTKSLQLDMDIYQYLKERSPSVDETPEVPDEPIKALPKVKQPPKVTKRANKAAGTTSNLLVNTGVHEGMTRQPTRTAELELSDRKRKGFFRRFNPFRRRKRNGEKKRGFASRVMSRMSFRSSYKGTTADEMRVLLDEKQVKTAKKAEEEGLFRKDSDLTDLSGDSDIDSSLLVNDKIAMKLPDDAQIDDEEAHKSRQSKIFEDEEEPKKRGSFLGTDVTKASDDLPLIKAKGDRKSDDKIEAEKKKMKVEKAFSLSSPSLNSPASPNVKVVKTGARKLSDLVEETD